MKVNKENFYENDIKVNQDQAWLLSYSDVTTVLLIFFIIFWAIEKKLKDQKIELIAVQDKTFQYTDSKYRLKEEATKADYLMAKKDITQLLQEQAPNIQKKVTIIDENQSLRIVFDGKVFFRSGSFEPSEDGLKVLGKVSDFLIKFQDDFSIDVQGHTDTSPVKYNKKRWWNTNMELSVLRALSIYKFLIGQGVTQDSLSVSGHGTHKIDRKNKDLVLDTDRKISLKMELKK